jgi:lipoyl(octanoyl) transferase
VIDVNRGGKITWHGPGQIVGYPIVRLARPTELVGFVREIESALIDTCNEFGLQVQRIKGRSGVWIKDDVNPELSAFSQIIPCGIADAEVTSMAKELRREISAWEVMPVLERNLLSTLGKVCA